MKKFVLVALISASASVSNGACDQASLSDNVKFYETTLNKEHQTAGNWFEHKLDMYPTVVLDSKTNTSCAAFYDPQKGWSTIQLKNSLKLAPNTDDLYTKVEDGVIDGDPANAGLLKELDELRKQRGLKSIFIYGWDENKPDLTNKDYVKYRALIPSDQATSMLTAIHESFHLLIQESSDAQSEGSTGAFCNCTKSVSPLGINLGGVSQLTGVLAADPNAKKIWPRFASQSVSDEDLQACYLGSPTIKEVHRKEMQAITDAFLEKDDAKSKLLIRDYLKLRDDRYKLDKPFTVKDWQGKTSTHNCKEEEARQELHEGVPQFVGNALILDQKLATPEQVATEIHLTTDHYLNNPLQAKERPIQSYYHTGSLSLLLMRRFYKGNFLDLTREISQPDSKVVVSDLLAKIIAQ